jgi:hypothetical protein
MDDMIGPVQPKSGPSATSGETRKNIAAPLKQGAIIKGTVRERLKNGEFIISSGGKDLRAHSSVVLRVGRQYDFQILSAKDRLELRVLEGNARVTGNISGFISSANTIGQKLTQALSNAIQFPSIKMLPDQVSGLMDKLQEMLKRPISAKDIPQIVSWVTKNIQGSGIFWEAKLLQLIMGKKGEAPKEMADQDVKAILLNILKNLEKAMEEKEGAKALSINVREVLNLIEQEQVMNLETIRDGIGWFVNLPFIDRDDFLSSELFIKKEREGGLHFSIFLDMTFTGRMNIDTLFLNETASIMIYVENEKTREFIIDNGHELEEAFKKAGFTTGKIRCEVRESVVPDEAVEKAGHSQVDITI